MSQPMPPAPIVAHQALWTFVNPQADGQDEDYYKALEGHITQEIARAFHGGGRAWVGRELRVRVGQNTILAHLANVEPVLATVISNSTRIIAKYRERPKEQSQDISNFIAEIIHYPMDEEFGWLYDSLVGMDHIKEDLFHKLSTLLAPDMIKAWAKAVYKEHVPRALVSALRDRYPLLILEGEVGSGKTALARSIGYPLARSTGKPVTLYVVNAQVRGGGHVGELSLNISRAFTEAELACQREGTPVIVLIDEADALAQARGGRQRHIEDDAGVNTLIQRIDRLRGKPMAVIFATNLVQTLDAALLRRSACSYFFDRPTAAQRAETFRRVLSGTAISEEHIASFVRHTEPKPIRGFADKPQRYTYSDLTQRILPGAVENALWAQSPLTAQMILDACDSTPPTPETAMPRHIASLGREAELG